MAKSVPDNSKFIAEAADEVRWDEVRWLLVRHGSHHPLVSHCGRTELAG